jgi:hypothetical protein
MPGQNPEHGGSVVFGKILIGYQRGCNAVDKLTEILEAQHVGLKSSIMNDRFVLSV